jgi:hypothetical protein
MGGFRNGEQGSEGQGERCRGVWMAVRGFVEDPGAGRVVGTCSRGILVVLGACYVVSELRSVVPRGPEREVWSSSTTALMVTWQIWWMREASRWARAG